MTPSQEAKQFAADNGFVIATVGRRYKVTNIATGHTFERGGYEAVLNAMRLVRGGEHAHQAEQLLAKGMTSVDDEMYQGTAVIGNVVIHDRMVTSEFGIAQDLPRYRPKPIVATSREYFAKWPWELRVCGIHIGSYGTYAQAVKALRRNYNANARQDRVLAKLSLRRVGQWAANITYVGA